MKPLRLRQGPPVGPVAVAVLLSLVPTLYLALVLFGKETFQHFIDGPVWVFVVTVPLLLIRRLSIIDRESLQVRWGIWIPGLFVLPFFWRRRPIGGAAIVLLAVDVRGNDNGESTYYVTQVGGQIVAERLRYWPARRDAERVAQYLGLPLSDSVGNAAAVLRPPTSLSKSLRARLLDGEVKSPEPDKPEWTDLVRRDRDGVFSINRPAVRKFTVVYPKVAFYLLLNAVVWIEYALDGPPAKSSEAIYVLGPMVGIVGAIGCIRAIYRATVHWSVELTDETLRVRTQSWIARSSKAMKLTELEELTIEDRIRLRSDRAQIEFAHDLEKEEREWVAHELLRRLRGT